MVKLTQLSVYYTIEYINMNIYYVIHNIILYIYILSLLLQVIIDKSINKIL